MVSKYLEVLRMLKDILMMVSCQELVDDVVKRTPRTNTEDELG